MLFRSIGEKLKIKDKSDRVIDAKGCLNGAAARCVSTGDKIIIMAYAGYEPEEARTHKPAVVFVDEENKISRVTNYEKHGLLKDMA